MCLLFCLVVEFIGLSPPPSTPDTWSGMPNTASFPKLLLPWLSNVLAQRFPPFHIPNSFVPLFLFQCREGQEKEHQWKPGGGQRYAPLIHPPATWGHLLQLFSWMFPASFSLFDGGSIAKALSPWPGKQHEKTAQGWRDKTTLPGSGTSGLSAVYYEEMFQTKHLRLN